MKLTKEVVCVFLLGLIIGSALALGRSLNSLGLALVVILVVIIVFGGEEEKAS